MSRDRVPEELNDFVRKGERRSRAKEGRVLLGSERQELVVQGKGTGGRSFYGLGRAGAVAFLSQTLVAEVVRRSRWLTVSDVGSLWVLGAVRAPVPRVTALRLNIGCSHLSSSFQETPDREPSAGSSRHV